MRGSSCGSGVPRVRGDARSLHARVGWQWLGNGPTGVGPLSRAAEEHARRWRAQIEAAVAAALERRDNRSRARARAPLTAEERTAAFDAALGLVAPCAWRLARSRPDGARGRRSRTALCGDGLRVAGRSALRCHTALCHLGHSAVLLLLQPAAVVEQAREAAMRALTGGRARGRRRCNEALRLLTVL